MNLFTLVTAQLNDNLLKDGNWQKADFYDLSTDSTFWNRACIISLTKAYAKTSDIALIYLLQKETNALGIWQTVWGDTIPTISELIHYFIAERGFTNAEGKGVSIESFWQKYCNTIEGITTAPCFEFSKNEMPQQFTQLFNKEEILQVICFDDTWDEQNFFIETETEWMLYHWSSAA